MLLFNVNALFSTIQTVYRSWMFRNLVLIGFIRWEWIFRCSCKLGN